MTGGARSSHRIFAEVSVADGEVLKQNMGF